MGRGRVAGLTVAWVSSIEEQGKVALEPKFFRGRRE